MAAATKVNSGMNAGQLVAFFQELRPCLNRTTLGESYADLHARIDEALASSAERGIKPLPWRAVAHCGLAAA